MIRIRTKLLIFSIILIIIPIGMAFFLFQNGQDSINQYDTFLSRFFLLNKISKTTDHLYQSLEAYLTTQSSDDYQSYLSNRNELETLEENVPQLQTQYNSISLFNYKNMIKSYLEESNTVTKAFDKKKIDLYTKHMTEAEKIKGYIHQSTLDLIDSELTNYNTFYTHLQLKDLFFKKMSISMVLSILFLTLFFSLWFSRSITKPIGRLTRAAEAIAKGHLSEPPVEVSTRDEMRLLTSTFNTMQTRIIKLIDEMKEKAELDKMLKEMELKHLQSQINPHFLFNVLNTISKKAYLEDADETSQLIDSVATLLRYNLGKLDHPVTIQQELKIIKDYFYIQTTRFEERVTFKLKSDEHILNQKIPNLSIQPLIENAFIHGIEPYDKKGTISVEVKDCQDHVEVSVEDNGIGMDQNTLEKILSEDEDPSKLNKSGGHSTGLGLKNVIRRLQLFYEKKDIIEIESAPNKGTKIKLLLPKEDTA